MKRRKFRIGDVHLRFLYSQEISNGKTLARFDSSTYSFLYSQEISNKNTSYVVKRTYKLVQSYEC